MYIHIIIRKINTGALVDSASSASRRYPWRTTVAHSCWRWAININCRRTRVNHSRHVARFVQKNVRTTCNVQ